MGMRKVNEKRLKKVGRIAGTERGGHGEWGVPSLIIRSKGIR